MCIPLSFPPLAPPTPTTSDVDPAGSEYRGTSARAPIPVDTSALPQPLHLSPPGLASALPSPGGASTATPERLWPNVNPQSHAGQQAAATSASGSAADRRHVSQSHTPLQRFTQATMAAWPAAADVVGVGLAAPSHRYCLLSFSLQQKYFPAGNLVQYLTALLTVAKDMALLTLA